jgi:hypothetical protein
VGDAQVQYGKRYGDARLAFDDNVEVAVERVVIVISVWLEFLDAKEVFVYLFYYLSRPPGDSGGASTLARCRACSASLSVSSDEMMSLTAELFQSDMRESRLLAATCKSLAAGIYLCQSGRAGFNVY